VERIDVQVAGFADLDVLTAYELWRLREAVFVVEQQCPYPELDGRDCESATRHVWVSDEGRPVAYLRILDDPDAARIGRVAVAVTHRRRGLAALLMERAHALTVDRPTVLDAQSYLAPWYAGLGYEPTGPEFLDDGIPHIPMRRAG
jgi:ElaA protein